MNISQAETIYKILSILPEDHPFWDDKYTKSLCFMPYSVPGEDVNSNYAAWYTIQKQYYWVTQYRRNYLAQAISLISPEQT